MAADLPAGGELPGIRTERCPGCGAALRPAAPWCTQCFLDLRTPVPAPPDQPPVALPTTVPPTAGWPCPCGASNDLLQDACASCGSGLFDALRGDAAGLLRVPVLGDVAGVSKVRLGLAALVVLPVLLGVLLAVWALAGVLLT